MSQYEFDFPETPSDPPTPFSVSGLTSLIREMLRESFPHVLVVGEISNLTVASSGHVYFSLKDDAAQINAVMWRSRAQRLRFQPRNGMAVLCAGSIDVYPPRGSYQLVVDRMEPQGIGDLQLAFQQLREKLAAEGLFRPERKRPLPRFPQRVAFVTSPEGAALHDFLETARKRWPGFRVVVIPSAVQGKKAVADLVRGIKLAHRLSPLPDVLVVGRGGGSMEDLWAFNEEQVVRAVAASQIPTVSAVGHEIDVTLCDFAADKRALTPTDAAQIIFPDHEELRRRLRQLAHRALSGLKHARQQMQARLEALTKRGILARPHDLHLWRRQEVDEWEQRAVRSLQQLLQANRQRLVELTRAAEALSPLAVLQRGYSVTMRPSDWRPVTDASQVKPGDTLVTVVARGEITSKVEQVQAEHRYLLPNHQGQEAAD
ncbi:MAG: exodeoxyribonuclease 7 large subunit [Pirellulaceae bacterium]|nr:MAG: exodeoxyribonuclease 7 large subunit [Pirellulaceae bacterium]